VEASSTLISHSARGLAQSVASHVSRRSFFGWVGRFALVAATAGWEIGLLADPAFAVCDCPGRPGDANCSGSRSCPCASCAHSVSCKGLGFSNTSCPSGSVTCGSWTCSNCSACPSGVRVWHDCCPTDGSCAAASTCRCVTDTDGGRRPTCCNKKFYADESGGCANFIKCRIKLCA